MNVTERLEFELASLPFLPDFLWLFIIRPTNAQMWHKAVFKVGPVAGPKPHASGKAKNTFDTVGIPLFGAPQAPGNKPTPPPKGVKAWGDGPLRPEELSSAEAHPAEPPRGMTAYRMQPNNWRGKIRGPLSQIFSDSEW